MRRELTLTVLLGMSVVGCAEPPSARVDANKEVVRRFVSAMNEQNLDALDDLVAPDVVRRSPSTPGVTVRSLEELKAFLRQDRAAVPDAVQTIRMMVAEGDWVAVWANYSGTQDGPLGPFPASGNPVDLEFAGFLRIEDGMIAEIRAVWDNVDMLTQLGHMEPPGA